MSDVVITVRGEAERRVPPERATARVRIATDGTDRATVIDAVTQRARSVRAVLAAREASGGVAEWSSGNVSAWSERPWNSDGRRLQPVHHAAIEVRATFTDVEALSTWVGEIADADAVHVDGVEWSLHPDTRSVIEREVAADAVRAAVERAEAYAAAIGRREVTALQIADVGLLHDAGAPERAPRLLHAAAAEAGSAPIALQPADILISAAVEARFAAR